ncbi:hypothetical protein CLOP_g21969 [Closterium sp. NIES-67]|nr:hypothetical protein CLOP_g21969 [Closterium sp. NIES-67]
MENIFDHYDLLEVMEGMEKRPENDPEKSPWRAEVKGMGKAMFKGADGKMVGLKNVLLVPNLTANLISLGAAGAEYFLTIVDVYTRMTWVYVLPKKSDVAETVKTDWLPMVERQQDRLLDAKATWAVHLGMAQNSKGWLFWFPFTKKFLAISSKWLFKRKTDADGNIERYKSRLVAKGYQQQEKKDFNEVYAPVVKGTTLRTLFAAAAIKGWVVKQMDIVTAFLNGVLEEETYMEQPEGYNDGRFKCVKGPAEESVGEEDRRRFHSLVGSLMYAAVHTRPDAAFATGQLARVVQCPNEEQVAAGERVAKYLGQTATVGLQYFAAAQRRQKGADGVEPGRLFLTAFSDASWASEPEDMTSVGGFICCVGGGPTAWESKKQVDQALSSVESEYMALFRAIREVVWQRRLLAELGEEQQGPTPLYCDSQGAIALAKNPVLHGLTKHMKVKWHWVRSMVTSGEVELHYVKTTAQPADMMTKRLVEQQHWKCCKLAGMALN